MKRHAHNLSHTETSTVNMGTCVPCNIIEVFPGDSFKIQAKDLTRFLPQVAPTMHDVFVGVDTYQVPLRQIMEKIGINWDDFLTGGEDGTAVIDVPKITIPETGYEPGSLADFLGYPTNYTDPSTNEHVIVGAGLELSAIPVLVYMHIINENYRDQNFIKKFVFSAETAQQFLDGTYQFQDAAGNDIDYDLQREGLFPKAWSRDYFGRALPNTQRGPQATIPLGDSASLQPSSVPVISESGFTTNSSGSFNVNITNMLGLSASAGRSWIYRLPGESASTVSETVSLNMGIITIPYASKSGVFGNPFIVILTGADSTWEMTITPRSVNNGTCICDVSFVRTAGSAGNASFSQANTSLITNSSSVTLQSVNLGGVTANLSDATAAGIIAFRTAARMQQFGEALQNAGARAVEYTLKFFGVRIPDGRIQRPVFHGSFRMPVIFSEVLQTSQTSDTSPLATLGGHGITGGVNKPLHIKVIEHGFIMSIMHVMPRSQFQNIVPKYLLRNNRWDIPNPLFQGIGEQPIKRVEIYPNSENPDESFGYVPQFSELLSIPSTLHGHMKDTFLHWTMARVYNSEPVLSAAWRYEKPSDRSFAVQDEDQMQVCIGFEIHARRVFKANQRPGIHIV